MSDTQTKPDEKPEPAAAAGSGGLADRLKDPRRLAVLGVAVVGILVLLALPLYLSAVWLRVGEFAMTGAVAAIGLTMLIGHCGQLSLGTPFFMLLGATVYAVLADAEPASDLVGLGWPPLLALVVAVLASAGAGLAFAPVSGRVGGIYLGVATLALIFVGLYFGQRFGELTGGAATGRPTPPFTIGGFDFTGRDPELTLLGVPMGPQERLWYLFLLLVVGAALLATGAVRSRPGRSWRAVRDNPASAAAMGVNVAWARASAFAVSSAYAGLAGVMTIMWFGILKADENEFEGSWSIVVAISLLAMVIIGGLGSVWGAVFGAVFVFGFPLALQLWVPSVPFLQELTSGSGGFTPAVLTSFAYGALIVVVVIFEPGGLAAIGRRITARLSR